MSRRPAAGVADRHALLAGGAYPSSSSPTPSQLNRNGTLSPGGGAGGAHLQPRTASPFEQPYSHYSTGTPYAPSSSYNTSDPYSEYDRGAPKKEGQPGGGGGGAFGSFLSSIGARTAEDLEEQNDERLEGLSTKVKMLKDITLGIGNEVRDSTKDLDSLSEAFSNTSAFLGNTFSRMNRMARRQGGWFCNMMIFLILVIWIFVSRQSLYSNEAKEAKLIILPCSDLSLVVETVAFPLAYHGFTFTKFV
ncbi:hypothetical protein FA10DRAFT_246867 [Acaromyces ingoldii]|uniref:t-SNARE coiled-coil homology domain-containing protein n=1 Tax=Acaromyces ingoldii TaxID=215250 RepID=A0A316YUC5_9BASI|nr:hypothetical protein FA10DRAFT_246867 [Acaromyces ingoldii]PWN92869.1 hypothetical protein FA10DRAFT_246867 [Acaromyces ingoldii]